MIEDILDSLREPELSRGHRNRNFPKAGRAPNQWEPERLQGRWHLGGRLKVPKDMKEFEAGVTGQSKRQDRWAH